MSSSEGCTTLEEFQTESAAQSAVDAIRLTINRQTPQQLLKNVSVETLVKHYQEHELPDVFSKQKPATGNSDEHHKLSLIHISEPTRLGMISSGVRTSGVLIRFAL